MRVAILGHKRIPSREGGVEIVVEELSVRMAQKGCEVDVYNRKGTNVADKNADLQNHKLKEYCGVKILSVPTPNIKSLNAIIYSFFATVRIVFRKYDVVHYHAEGPCAMLPLAHFFGKHTVATIHGLDWQRAKWGGFATRFLLFGEKMAAKYADEIIVLSKNVQKYFLDTYNRDTLYIPNGVNIPKNKECKLINSDFGLQEGRYILFLARIVPEKGIHYLLEAFSEVDTDIKLVIAGGASHSGDYFDKIQKMASKDPRVIMTGFIQGERLEELFSNCLLYVLPSDIEGMPISLLEAMSYGCRCLVSDIAENVEAAGNNAMTFKKGDVADLRDKLNHILSIPYSRNEDAIAYVKQNYNWDNIVDELLNVYARGIK